MSEVTAIVNAIVGGDRKAAADLLPLVYDELRRLAQKHMAQERGNHTLQATALVHESYLRLIGTDSDPGWDGKGHFFAAAAEAMRRILIDHARRKRAIRHGGGLEHIDGIEEALAASSPSSQDSIDDMLALNGALDRLARQYPAKAELVKLRYFVGLSFDEAAEAMGISRSTAIRHWTFARAWLRDAITGDAQSAEAASSAADGKNA